MANISQQVVYERTREVYYFMLNNSKQRKEIMQYFIPLWEKEGIFSKELKYISKVRTIDNYIKKVNKSFLNFDSEVEVEKGRTLARLEYLYQQLCSIKDYKGALSIIKEVGDIVGFKATQKIDIKSDGEQLKGISITVNSEEARQAIEKISEKHKI